MRVWRRFSGSQRSAISPTCWPQSPIADRARVRDAVTAALEQSDDRELDVDVVGANGVERRRCALTIAAVHDQEGQPGVLMCVSDITDQARTHQELRVRATTYPLTGVLNLSAGAVDLHASVGLAFNEPGDTCDVLMARADSAMYQSKRGGGATVALYSDGEEGHDSAATLPAVERDAPVTETHVRSAAR